ncbi:MAG: 50S ribosomal protein L6 [Oscillospiraceae bacterium]|nr:50S ribosomal protein L6 [Oscillospiraceae bacterium]
MSRIGKLPIVIPAGVDVTIDDGGAVTVKGPKGTLTRTVHNSITLERDGAVISVTRPNDNKENRSLHGLTRTLVNNMVVGVSEGFKKELEINGVGYRAQKQESQLVLNVGYSHQVIMDEPEGVTVEVPAPNRIVVLGADKQKVGQFAAEIRGKRPPEPYKGKGIKYSTEVIRRKEGKAGKGGK